jgi:hypothetical protein
MTLWKWWPWRLWYQYSVLWPCTFTACSIWQTLSWHPNRDIKHSLLISSRIISPVLMMIPTIHFCPWSLFIWTIVIWTIVLYPKFTLLFCQQCGGCKYARTPFHQKRLSSCTSWNALYICTQLECLEAVVSHWSTCAFFPWILGHTGWWWS